MPLTRQELTQIESIIYEPAARKLELAGRKVFRVNQTFLRNARAVGYDRFESSGDALVTKAGSHHKEIPFVGEKGEQLNQPAYDLSIGIEYHNDELEEYRARAAMGQGASLPIERYRIENARRIVAEKENKAIWTGFADGEVKGAINHPDIVSGDVAATGTGANNTEKRLWANKTPQLILKDILEARTAARNDGVYRPNVLALPPSAMDRLDQPYSDQTPVTIRQWLGNQAGMLPIVVEAPELGSTYNGLVVDAFMVLDNRPFIVELAILRDMELGAFKETWDGWNKALLKTRTAGLIIREGKALVLRKGI